LRFSAFHFSKSERRKSQKNVYGLKKKFEKSSKKFFSQKWPELPQSYQKSPKIEIWVDFARFTAIFRPNFEMSKITNLAWNRQTAFFAFMGVLERAIRGHTKLKNVKSRQTP